MRGTGRVYLRGPTWWIAYYRNGTQHRESTGQGKKSVAVERLKERVASVQAGTFVQPRKTTVNELLDALEADYKANSRKTKVKYQMASLRAAFGPDLASSVTEVRLETYKRERLATKKGEAEDSPTIAPKTINNELAVLRSAFKLALDLKLVSSMPRFKPLHVRNVRTGFVDPDAFDEVAAHLEPVIADLARLAYSLAWRKAEVSRLEWENVDLRAGTIRLWETKNESPRVVALSAETRTILERRQADRGYTTPDGIVHASPFVFHRHGQPIRSFRGAWTAAAEAAGKSGLLFHDLRRSGVRNLIRAGVPERVAMSISGHKTRAVFDRYNITSEEDLQAAAASVERYVRAKRSALASVQKLQG